VKVDGLASVDDAVGDGGAVDDAAEHVNENGLNSGIINRLLSLRLNHFRSVRIYTVTLFL
jgi:hypothetical protein